MDKLEVTPAPEPIPQLSEPEPPAAILDPHDPIGRGGSDGRLAAVLRAQVGQPPAVLLAHAARRFAAGEDDLARAFADLAVTGRAAVARYDAAAPSYADVEAATAALGQTLGLIPIERARNRAAEVRAYLDASAEGRAGSALGWIAVSGEDDPPWRPVNASVTRFPQRDVQVTVDGISVSLRYVQTGPLIGRRVVVLLHGHSSRLEEYEELMAALHEVRAPNGLRAYTVLALDLPGSGYSSFVEPSQMTGEGPIALAFTARAVVAFVEAVFAQAGVAPDVAAIGGGSLGGNLALIFGEHRPAWLQAIAPWSPAAMWGWDLLRDVGKGVVTGRIAEPEQPASRKAYFLAVYNGETPPAWVEILAQPFINYADFNQSTQWYGASWPGKRAALRGSRRDRHETYHPTFRRWHWRLAAEQLDQLHGTTALATIACPVLILAGAEDNYDHANIFDRVKDAIVGPLAPRPGTGYLLHGVGHSIHNERPAFLASALHTFLTAHTRRSLMPTDIQLEPDKVLVNSTYLEVAGPGGTALELDGDAARQRDGVRVGGDRRRALVHASGDQLMINYDGDYTGGVLLHGGLGKITLSAPTVELAAATLVKLSGPTVAIAQGTRVTLTYRESIPNPRGGHARLFDNELDLLTELLALRRELNELKQRVGA